MFPIHMHGKSKEAGGKEGGREEKREGRKEGRRKGNCGHSRICSPRAALCLMPLGLEGPDMQELSAHERLESP